MKDLIFEDRQILPMKADYFGIILTDAEATRMLSEGYSVKAIQFKSDENIRYYLPVKIGAYVKTQIDLAMLETTGRGDVTVMPYEWEVGRIKGIKAYVRDAIPTKAHADDRPLYPC